MYIDTRVIFPLYDSLTLRIIICDDDDTIGKEIGEVDHEYFACAYRKNESSRELITVFNPKSHDNILTPGVITHEAIHIKNMVFDTVGIKADPNNDEPEAYLTEWIVNQIYKVFSQVNREVYNNIKI